MTVYTSACVCVCLQGFMSWMAHRAKVEPGGCIETDPYNPEWQLFVVETILSPPASIAGVRLCRRPSSLAGRPCHLMGADNEHSCSHLSTTGRRPSGRGLSLFGSSSSVCSLSSLSLCLSVTLSSFLCATKKKQTGAQQETSHSSSHASRFHSRFHLAGWLTLRKPQKADIC